MELHFDKLVERLIEQLPSASAFYAALPPEILRGAAVNLYKILRDSVEDGGIDRYAEAITQIAHTRTAQGGSLDDLRAATELVRRLNLEQALTIVHQVTPGVLR